MEKQIGGVVEKSGKVVKIEGIGLFSRFVTGKRARCEACGGEGCRLAFGGQKRGFIQYLLGYISEFPFHPRFPL